MMFKKNPFFMTVQGLWIAFSVIASAAKQSHSFDMEHPPLVEREIAAVGPWRKCFKENWTFREFELVSKVLLVYKVEDKE